VQIADAKGLASVDLSKGGKVSLGQEMFGVSRLNRSFDYAPEILRLYASRRVENPRLLWGISGEFAGVGLPVYDLDGVPVGVLSIQGGSDDTLELGAFALTLEDVAKSINDAKKQIPAALESARKAKEAAKPVEGAAMEGTPAMEDAPAMGDAPKPHEVPPAPANPDAPKDEKDAKESKEPK
jgi:hypothetical protein